MLPIVDRRTNGSERYTRPYVLKFPFLQPFYKLIIEITTTKNRLPAKVNMFETFSLNNELSISAALHASTISTWKYCSNGKLNVFVCVCSVQCTHYDDEHERTKTNATRKSA